MEQIFTLALLILISILPALFLLWFFEKQDKGEKEPRKLKNKVFFWGVFSTIIAAAIELNLGWLIPSGINFWVYTLIIAFIGTALVEEGLKFWIVKRVAWPHKKFNEVMDGITYAIIAGLGFAVLENLLFVIPGGVQIGILRAVLAVPAHALFSGIMGYYIGRAKFEKTPWDARNALWKGFGLAVLYHGLYDFFLLSESWLWICIVPLMVFMIVQLKYLINKARYEDKVQKRQPTVLNFIRGLRIVSATIFVIVGVLHFAGTIMLVKNGSPAAWTWQYTSIDILYSGIIALILFFVAFLLIRKKKIAK